MTVSAKDVAVLESPKVLLVGETRAFAIDFSGIGTPSLATDTYCYDEVGQAAPTLLSGSTTLQGAVATSKLFTPTAEGMFLLLVDVTIDGQRKYGAVYVAVSDKTHSRAALGTGVYGSSDGVAMLIPRFANKTGKFDDTTHPRHNDVIALLAQVSSVLNVQLAQFGFTVPVTDADVKPMLDMFVNEEVASVVEGINGLGRFSPRGRTGESGSRFRVINSDISAFLATNANGLASMGASRPESNVSGIGFRETDEAGTATFPLFERKGYGDDSFQKDWDK